MTFSQADLARTLGLHDMAVSRMVKAIGGIEHPLSERSAILVLTAGVLRSYGLTFTRACRLVSQFQEEFLHVAIDPQARKRWLVFVAVPGRMFTIAAVSHTHLGSIIAGHPLARALSLAEPVEEALELLGALKSQKSWSAE